MARKLDVTYTVCVEPEDIPFVGNASAIDPETDAQTEEWIRSELDRGNDLAWCWVRVIARAGDFEGDASCGGISCRNLEELERVFLPDLRAEALADLKRELSEVRDNAVRDACKRATAAALTLAKLPKRAGRTFAYVDSKGRKI